MAQDIKYAVTYETLTVSDAEYDLVIELQKIGQKVPAIKFIRSQYHIGLKEAKDVCDAICDAGSRLTY